MGLLQHINRQALVGLTLLALLLLFVGLFVRSDVQVTFFFTAIYTTTLGYLIVERYLQARNVVEDSALPPRSLLQTAAKHLGNLLSSGRFSRELVIAILLVLSFAIALLASLNNGGLGAELIVFCVVITLLALAYSAISKIRRQRKKITGEIVSSPQQKPAEVRRHPARWRRFADKKVLLAALFLLLLIPILITLIPEAVIVVTMLFASAFILLYLVVDRFIQKSKVDALTEASLRAEVDSLKAQINPHFFFNTLNNLYGLTVEKSDSAPEVILKLSDMMRYTIYEGQKDRVALSDEIAYLENYIELHKIRYQRDLDIRFQRDVADETLHIPPLLLIVLLENAFKHGVESLTENAFVHIKLASTDGTLRFELRNNFEAEDERPVGIGLKNLRRRLDLLLPHHHKLSALVEDDYIYCVVLELEGL